ncbi:hypothetical protein BV20DRAFT_826243 [Pilatotrama ljubarskyi]|nr:hypothetical protein BV20DRAFT_826243 [Pilatotrama ljubarskyi]
MDREKTERGSTCMTNLCNITRAYRPHLAIWYCFFPCSNGRPCPQGVNSFPPSHPISTRSPAYPTTGDTDLRWVGCPSTCVPAGYTAAVSFLEFANDDEGSGEPIHHMSMWALPTPEKPSTTTRCFVRGMEAHRVAPCNDSAVERRASFRDVLGEFRDLQPGHTYNSGSSANLGHRPCT